MPPLNPPRGTKKLKMLQLILDRMIERQLPFVKSFLSQIKYFLQMDPPGIYRQGYRLFVAVSRKIDRMDHLKRLVPVAPARCDRPFPVECPFRLEIEIAEAVLFFIRREWYLRDVAEAGIEARGPAPVQLLITVADDDFPLSAGYLKLEYEIISASAGFKEDLDSVLGREPCQRPVLISA